MVSSTSDAISQPINRDEIVPSRKRIKLPAWLEVAKPRLIPLLLVRFIRLSRSFSQRQLRAPAAAAARAPPPKVHASLGEGNGHSSERAIPPTVVASKRGIKLGLETSSQAGNLIRFLDGTMSSRLID